MRQFQHELFTVWRCTNCQSLHSREDVALDAYYAGYPNHNQRLDYFSRRLNATTIRVLHRHGLRKENAILDYGCGGGLVCQLFQENGYENVVGYDPYVEQFADPDLLQRDYDAVVSLEVIEHVDDPRQHLRELSARVQRGGLVLVTTPCANRIKLNELDRATYHLHQPYHRHLLSEEALLQAADLAGLQPAFSTTTIWDTYWPAVNERFFYEFTHANGNNVDCQVEPVQFGHLLMSPRVWLSAVFGSFLPLKAQMLVLFTKN